jgi:hypothetical protein
MIRIRMPAISEIKGDSEMPTTDVKARNIGQSPSWLVYGYVIEASKVSKVEADGFVLQGGAP